jgi:hypothetical protein
MFEYLPGCLNTELGKSPRHRARPASQGRVRLACRPRDSLFRHRAQARQLLRKRLDLWETPPYLTCKAPTSMSSASSLCRPWLRLLYCKHSLLMAFSFHHITQLLGHDFNAQTPLFKIKSSSNARFNFKSGFTFIVCRFIFIRQH